MMLHGLVLANFLVCSGLAASHYARGSPFFVFFLFLNGLVVFPGFREALGTVVDYHPFATPLFLSRDLFRDAHLLILACLLLFALAEVFASRPAAWPRPQPASPLFLAFPVLILLLLALMVQLHGRSVFRVLDFVTLRSGTLGFLPLAIQYLSILSAPLVALYTLQRDLLCAGLVLAVLVLSAFLLGGSRQALFLSMLMLVILMGRRGWAHFTLLFLFAVLLFPVLDPIFSALKTMRNLPGLEARVAFVLSPDPYALMQSTGESTLRYVFYTVVGASADWVGAGEFSYLRRLGLFWLPSPVDSLGIKPPDFEAVVFHNIMGGRSGTMHPTYFGMVLADSGRWFALWVLLTVLIFRFFERLAKALRLLPPAYLWALLCYLATMWARGSFYAPVMVVLSFLILAPVLLLGWRMLRAGLVGPSPPVPGRRAPLSAFGARRC